MKCGFVLGSIALCGLFACAGDDQAAAFGDRDIEGTVVDEFSSHAISGAKVVFVSDTLDRAETTTDQAGRFVLHVEVPEGVRFGTIEASHAGYADSAKASVFFDESALPTELKLRPTGTPAPR